MAKSRKRERVNKAKPKPKVGPGRTHPPKADLEETAAPQGAWYVMGRGGKWFVVTVAIAAVTSATALAVNKTGEKITAPSAPSGAPVAVASVSVNDPDGGDSFAFPQPIDLNQTQLAAIQDGGDPKYDHHDQYFQWMANRGGVIANEEGMSLIQLTLRGNRDYQVRILDMQSLEQCQAPLTGTLFYSPSAGEGPSAALGFDLDKPHSSAKQYSFETGFGDNYFPAKTISLNYKEQQVLSVFSKTKQYCEFRVRLKVLDGDKTV
jgi:hypothetical protein